MTKTPKLIIILQLSVEWRLVLIFVYFLRNKSSSLGTIVPYLISNLISIVR